MVRIIVSHYGVEFIIVNTINKFDIQKIKNFQDNRCFKYAKV